MTPGRDLLARHIDCPGVCDVWVERDALLAMEDELTRLTRIERKARLVSQWHGAIGSGPIEVLDAELGDLAALVAVS